VVDAVPTRATVTDADPEGITEATADGLAPDDTLTGDETEMLVTAVVEMEPETLTVAFCAVTPPEGSVPPGVAVTV
jgi:hypothetical protein